MQDFEDVVDTEQAEKDAEKILKGDFNFDDFVQQLEMLKGMGPLQEIFEKMPMIGDMMPKGFQVDEKELVRIRAMIDSMTKSERRNPDLINDSRMKRVARGSGHGIKQVKDLMERFRMARVMMKEMGRATGLMGKMPGMKQAAGLARLKRQGMSMDPSMLSSLGEMAGADGGMPGMPGMGMPGERKKKGNPKKKKAARKKQRAARKKNRR